MIFFLFFQYIWNKKKTKPTFVFISFKRSFGTFRKTLNWKKQTKKTPHPDKPIIGSLSISLFNIFFLQTLISELYSNVLMNPFFRTWSSDLGFNWRTKISSFNSKTELHIRPEFQWNKPNEKQFCDFWKFCIRRNCDFSFRVGLIAMWTRQIKGFNGSRWVFSY